MSAKLNITAGEPEVRVVDFSTAHLSEAAVLGGRPHRYPSWLCKFLHKKHFISCWSEDPKWRTHVLCGHCQQCRHFRNTQLRYNWMPPNSKPHRFHVRVWPNGQSQIEINELYLHEILRLIEVLATQETDKAADADIREMDLTTTSTGGGCSYQWRVNTLDKHARLRVLNQLFLIYFYVLDGSLELPTERRWWHKLQ